MSKQFYFDDLPFELDVMDTETYKTCKTEFYAVVLILTQDYPSTSQFTTSKSKNVWNI